MRSPPSNTESSDLVGATFQEFFHELALHLWLPKEAIVDAFRVGSKEAQELHKMVVSLATSGGHQVVPERLTDFLRGNDDFAGQDIAWLAKDSPELLVAPEPSKQ